MTGWGQAGPLAHTAGHDINYLALTGGLHLIGERGRKPVPPLNLVADFGGGGMMLLAGMLAALLEASRSGKGQVIDAAMTDGVIALLSIMYSQRAAGYGFADATGESLLAGAAPYYGTYETRDGKYLALGSIEPQFYAQLVDKLGLDRKFLAAGYPAGRESWPETAAAISGKRFVLEPNPYSVKALALTFKDRKEAVLHLDMGPGFSDRPRLEFLVGLEGVPRLAPGRFGLTVACQGAWKSPDTFVIEIDEVANINRFRLELTFEDGRLSGSLAETTGLGAIPIRGKLG
jgi:hypothetical protein